MIKYYIDLKIDDPETGYYNDYTLDSTNALDSLEDIVSQETSDRTYAGNPPIYSGAIWGNTSYPSFSGFSGGNTASGWGIRKNGTVLFFNFLFLEVADPFFQKIEPSHFCHTNIIQAQYKAE